MLIESITLKRKTNDEIVLKLTVEERKDGFFISTYWELADGLELNRHVKEYETISGAWLDMYRNAISYMGALLLDEKYEIDVRK